MKRLATALPILSLSIVTHSSAAVARDQSGFFSGGRRHTLAVDTNLIAIPTESALYRATPWAEILTQREIAQFRALDVVVIDAALARPGDDDGIVPVWFGDTMDTVGLLNQNIVVKLDPTRAGQIADDVLTSVPGHVAHQRLRLSPDGWYTARFDSPTAALDAANELYGQDGVIYAHPDFQLQIDVRSAATAPESEPLFPFQWHLRNNGQSGGTPGADLRIADAWQITTGTPSTLVAIIDVGVEQTHPDLQAAWFINTREIPGNKRDDDNNGLIDDVSGWNFSTDGNKLIYGRSNKHGTATAGIVGARANGFGVTGGCPNCAILPIVVDGEPSRDAQTMWYAKSMNAAVVTNSWGYVLSSPKTDVVVEAINDLAANSRGGKGATILFAMANANKNDCRPINPDISSLESVLAVSSVDHNDLKVTESAHGPCMDFVGTSGATNTNSIVTTDRVAANGYNTAGAAPDLSNPDYTNTFYGTSAASPAVAGVFGLLYSLRPDLTAAEAFRIVRDTADKIRPTEAKYDPATGHSDLYGFGRPNALKALTSASRL